MANSSPHLPILSGSFWRRPVLGCVRAADGAKFWEPSSSWWRLIEKALVGYVAFEPQKSVKIVGFRLFG